MIVSIIIPIYNVKEYIVECLNSVCNQTYKEIEIILVDDGSTDGSGEMCDGFKKKDFRIKVIHKKNGGLSSARNSGLDIAKGDYITFVDSDDVVSESFVSELMQCAKLYDTDIACCGIKTFEDGNFNNKSDFMSVVSGVFSTEDYIKSILSHKSDNAVWNKIYNRNTIGDLRFKEGIINEDFPFIMSFCTKVNKIGFTDKRLYYYRKRPGSITQSMSRKAYNYVENALWFKEEIAPLYKAISKKYIDSYIFTEMIGFLGNITKYGKIPADAPQEFKYYAELSSKTVKSKLIGIMVNNMIPTKQKIKVLILIMFPNVLRKRK